MAQPAGTILSQTLYWISESPVIRARSRKVTVPEAVCRGRVEGRKDVGSRAVLVGDLMEGFRVPYPYHPPEGWWAA
eukprot:293221-Rhodomonas_salina.2